MDWKKMAGLVVMAMGTVLMNVVGDMIQQKEIRDEVAKQLDEKGLSKDEKTD